MYVLGNKLSSKDILKQRISFSDVGCLVLTVSSSGPAGVLYENIMGSYMYHMTNSNGYRMFLGPQDTYIYNDLTYNIWAVSCLAEIRAFQF